MTPEERQHFNDALKDYELSPKKAYEMSQNIARARKQAEGIPLFGNGYIGNFAGGTASSFLRGMGNTAGFLNFNNVSDALHSGADYFDERLPPAKQAELSLDYLTSPSGLARGTGNEPVR